ncbi:ABC transporter permease [Saccharopolyspora sp. NFXS83]|uniref:ABC transporter permease n=1 Tax=Saccharopolyspora sp. NFXS83 TaxID=2993560 RepID=UPI00224A759C|nr:ABC transporter permease [Saccharopolyspora sp. NFXS83]MCX2729041.1 ABC transporter permease [Saccharopolyspora sp. NFXS83]
MSPLRTVWTVARREVNTRIRTRSFLISTGAILAILVGYAALMFFIGQQGATSKIGFTGQATAVATPFERTAARLGTTIESTRIPDQATGEELVADGELDGLVAGAPDSLNLIVRSAPDSGVRTALDEVVRQQALDAELAMAGLEPADVHAVLAGAHVDVRTLEPDDPQRGQRLGMAVGAGMLLYFFLIMFGQAVAQGVVEEKTSRVVEILLSTIRPTQLLAGKVLGIGLAGLAQFVLIGGIGLAAAVGSGVLVLPSAALLGTMLWALVWFLLGFYLYATVLAAAASLVSRQEDLQSVVTPVIMLLVIPFIVGLTVLPNDPESSLGAVLSLVPGFSPVLMPMRTALGVAAPWESAVAVLLSIAALAGLLRLGGRIYANAILRTGARVKLTDALRRT